MIWALAISKCMTTEKKTEKIKKPRKMPVDRKKAPSRGGVREGAGRPKGSSNKMSAQSILDALDQHLGHSYADQLAMNYLDALAHHDRNIRASYDRLFLGKVVADKVEVDVHSEDLVAQKQAAFAEAIAQITGIQKQ